MRAKRVTLAFAVLLGGYAALCVAARLLYPRILFPAPRVTEVPRQVAAAIAREGGPQLLELAQKSGGPTRALLWAAPPGGRTAVLFHGNGETMFDSLEIAEIAASRGLGVMLVEYRGYGLSHGPPPTEAAMYDDAEAALAHLAARGVGPDRVALWGTSLGTGVAVEMARRGRASRLVLVTPYTSIAAMGRRVAPFLPIDLVMTHRFDTLAKAPALRVPTLVVHGDADEVIPFAMGEEVARAIPGARLVRVAGGHHNDLFARTSDLLGTVLDYVTRP